MKARQHIQKGLNLAGLAVLGLALVAQPVASAFAATAGTEKAPSQPNVVTYTVTNTNNSGTGSLREAISLANANPGKDKIVFNITQGSGVRTILPISALPPINDPVELDATTQPGYAGTPLIELDGSSAGPVQAGLKVSGSGRGSLIKGLAINRFNGAGVMIIETGDVTLESNFIGTNPAGTVAQGNGGPGVYTEWTSNVIIGGTTGAARNLISGNIGNGITIQGVTHGSVNNQVLGNYIGTNISGTAALGNGGHGVAIQGSSGNVVGQSLAGARNLISGNGGSGVRITGGAASNKVQGNFIGTNATGTASLGNGAGGVTIRDGSSWNNVGGVGAEGNLISGNLGNGVLITGSLQVGSNSNTVSGNYIGTDINGMAPLTNTLNGVFIDNAASNHIGGFVEGHRNVISGNGANGVLISGSGSVSNKVQANYIGTNASGILKLSNVQNGVRIQSASNNTIGGTNTAERNLLSGNHSGVWIDVLGSSEVATNNLIQGNFLGTDASGTARLGNNIAGVVLLRGARGNTIGGPQAGARNLISGNDYYGVFISDTSNNQIQNNYIGTNVSATGPVSNTLSGIGVFDGYTNTIGGGVGLGNLIAYNGEGVEVFRGAGNVINTNYIYGNDNLGINLRPNDDWGTGGPTPNDALDPDEGSNRLQNFPVLSANSTQSQIKGSLNSMPNTTFTIELFTNDTCDASGYGEGKTFLGTTVVTTGVNGNASFTFDPDAPVPGGTYVTATATDPGGNTSEFSLCLLVQGPPTATPTFTSIPSATRTATAIPSATNTTTGSNPSATPTRTATGSNPSPTSTSQVPGACQVSFTDVPEGSTFYQYVQCLACKGILGGYSDGTFRTNNDVTRGQLSKIVSNAAGFNEAVSGQTFPDVAPDSPFYPFIERMVSRDIIGGYGDGTFRPNNNATRGQISKIVSNARNYTEPVSGQTFSDVAPDSPFYPFIERMVSRGIISGYGDGTFRPNANATRGQTAKIVSNAFFPNCQTP
ncbi:MAG: S-layer homology domain-containing protein [Chloroflexota bacterium]|nr:S-layer homology domain-containing protein [Chloroflexota bacterium]